MLQKYLEYLRRLFAFEDPCWEDAAFSLFSKMRLASLESNSDKFDLGSLSHPDIKDHFPVVLDHL